MAGHYMKRELHVACHTRFICQRHVSASDEERRHEMQNRVMNEGLYIRLRKAGADGRKAKNYSGSFADTVFEMMKEKKISKRRLALDSNLSEKTVQRMRNDDDYEPTKQMVVAICVGLKLSSTEAHALIEKSPCKLRPTNYQDAVYMQILEEGGRQSIEDINECLRELGCELLGSLL